MSRSFGGSVVHDLAADDDAPVGDRLEPGDHPQRARLPAAARADQDDELPVGDLEVQLRDRTGPVSVDLRQLLERDLRHALPSRLNANSFGFAHGNESETSGRARSFRIRIAPGGGTRRCTAAGEALDERPRAPWRPCVRTHFAGSHLRPAARRRAARACDLSELHERHGRTLHGKWVGLENFRHEWGNPAFQHAVWHTFLFTVISQAIVLVVAGLIAHA